jgi:trehalose 6-phosphate phosphatase
MPYLLARRHVPTLHQFAASNVLVAFDYDGTLAPISATPERVRMRQRTRRLLRAVAQRYPCIVISGRPHEELARHLDGIPVWHVTGNHGIEPWEQTPALAEQVQAWVRQLRPRLAETPGVVVEDKTYSVAIHYRQARDKRAALSAILRSVRRLRGTRVVDGRQAVNLIPRGAPHKGTALDRARRLLVCDAAIYVGDDGTDEDAFTCAHPDRLLAIRVGARRRTGARYHLRSQADVDALLQALVAARPVRKPARRPPISTQ